MESIGRYLYEGNFEGWIFSFYKKFILEPLSIKGVNVELNIDNAKW